MVETSVSSPQLRDLGQRLLLQSPLSRCGQGPGLIILEPGQYSQYQQRNDSLDPDPLKKWAEESFNVVQITLDTSLCGVSDYVVENVSRGVLALRSQAQCTPKDRFGLLGMMMIGATLASKEADLFKSTVPYQTMDQNLK